MPSAAVVGDRELVCSRADRPPVLMGRLEERSSLLVGGWGVWSSLSAWPVPNLNGTSDRQAVLSRGAVSNPNPPSPPERYPKPLSLHTRTLSSFSGLFRGS
ncbi:hypothetical protein DPEC_G00268820 [Dallia pectoralis]|uniref:Uncharacterized protein n=1 Tax=Dallia pectoralis TaxID=75939 RepID=A0ACC2FPD3_DALPE|nr:hypothetical protein DPEC_G00268820 [Dallia pectoralis]